MSHICISTTKAINLSQLSAELATILGRTEPVALNGSATSICYANDPAEGTAQQLQQAIDAHVPNPDYGVPAEELELRTLKTIANDLIAGRKSTFQNNQERDRATALIIKAVLRQAGYNQ
jgi:hypothetical protein